MTDAVTGELLYRELCDACARTNRSLSAFVAPLFNGSSWKIEQLRIARKPKRETIDRVRALCAGQPIPPKGGAYVRDGRAFGLSRQQAEDAGIPPSNRSVYERHLLDRQLQIKHRAELVRAISEQARATRRPGQTLADRARELRQELA